MYGVPAVYIQVKGRSQVVECTPASRSDLAAHATDPMLDRKPSFGSAPEQPLYIHVPKMWTGLCNTYVPGNNTRNMNRLLWALQYFVAAGLYVVVSCQAAGLCSVIPAMALYVLHVSSAVHVFSYGCLLMHGGPCIVQLQYWSLVLPPPLLWLHWCL